MKIQYPSGPLKNSIAIFPLPGLMMPWNFKVGKDQKEDEKTPDSGLQNSAPYKVTFFAALTLTLKSQQDLQLPRNWS